MKKIKITHKDNHSGWSEVLSDLDAQVWVQKMIETNGFGKPERIVPHKGELGAEVYDDADVLEEIIEQTEQGERKMVKLKAEYTIEIEDISAQYALEQVIIKRKSEYPSPEEFMNAYFDGGPEALGVLHMKRLEIKTKYPKPGA